MRRKGLEMQWIGAALMILLALSASPAAAQDEGDSAERVGDPELDSMVPGDGVFGDDSPGLSVAWRRDLGSGYSALAVDGDQMVALYSDGTDDWAGSYDVTTGEPHWRYRIGDAYLGYDGSHDGPIATPAIDGGRVFVFSPTGRLIALDSSSGEELWTRDVAADDKARKPYYGFATSPLVLDGVLVVAIGVEEGAAVAGFDPATGEKLWEAGQDVVQYQSPIVMNLGGDDVVVAAGGAKLFGIRPSDGHLLFEHEHGGDRAIPGAGSMVPLAAGEGRVFLVNKGDSSGMYQITAEDDSFTVSELWRSNGLKNSYVPPVYHDGHIYGMSTRILTCVDAATGKTKWKSRQPGDGFPSVVGDRLVILTKAGTLHVARATPEGYDELASLELFDEVSWSGATLAGNNLIARSMSELVRVQVAQAAEADGELAAGLPPAGSAMGQFLAELAEAEDKAAAIDAFLEAQDGFPILEAPDLVHFVYRGEGEDLGIVGDIIGDRREDPMHRAPGTDLFVYSMRLESDARLQYRFIRDYEEIFTDPLNPRTEPEPRGFEAKNLEMSWFAMPAWRAPDHLAEGEVANGGRIETHTHKSEAIEDAERRIDVYLPAGYDDSSRRYPVVYVLNGDDALARGRMKTSLDRLIGSSVEPLIAVFLYVDPQRVFPEWWGPARDQHTAMLAEELVPFIDGQYRTLAEPTRRGVIGAGMSGYAAMWAALKRPDVLGVVGTCSITMLTTTQGELQSLVTTADEAPLRLYLDWATYDLRSPHEAWDMSEDNRELQAFLRERGYRPAGSEVPFGNGWGAWSQRTGNVLSSLFPLGSAGE